jgi:hypothetical protein
MSTMYMFRSSYLTYCILLNVVDDGQGFLSGYYLLIITGLSIKHFPSVSNLESNLKTHIYCQLTLVYYVQ